MGSQSRFYCLAAAPFLPPRPAPEDDFLFFYLEQKYMYIANLFSFHRTVQQNLFFLFLVKKAHSVTTANRHSRWKLVLLFNGIIVFTWGCTSPSRHDDRRFDKTASNVGLKRHISVDNRHHLLLLSST